MDTRRDIFQAISDPTRRAIIGIMMMQAMTPNALAEKFDCSRQAISRHIKIMQECGLLNSKHIGREIYYQVEAKKLKEIDKWLQPFRQLWEDRFDNLEKYLAKLQQEQKHTKEKK